MWTTSRAILTVLLCNPLFPAVLLLSIVLRSDQIPTKPPQIDLPLSAAPFLLSCEGSPSNLRSLYRRLAGVVPMVSLLAAHVPLSAQAALSLASSFS
ncbi:uncharacterized protein M421DRAFT_426138 [Didymella exigua CBS 183.55]|uniref:Uncharacterized protein n=1 Tax=Didymella exigua CBS 183.55 TaxID=1150837 RepID=A0A6A5R933_9PLEO|nr:uncharacterized protein M421DRAFT_426138 [Didymella exigua CBS 183.55]KAF1923166.1 hypothetical protein M421DRAFT_426138 [Didymella exigua CBS 183.55]